MAFARTVIVADDDEDIRECVAGVLRDEGFEVRVYTLDHPPPHVHVAKAGAIVRIDLATGTVTEIVGIISDRDVKRAERLVARHAKTFAGRVGARFTSQPHLNCRARG